MNPAPRAIAILGVVALLAGCSGSEAELSVDPARRQDFGILPEARISHTAHYKIISTATDRQTAQVAEAVEALYGSYIGYFGAGEPGRKLEIVLYKNQSQFRTYNRSSPWAEAYYRTPRSYAYFSDGDNPYHWMIHEVTHQLLREHSGYRPAKWINEGIASYFGSSTMAGPALRSGKPDPAAYPIWWLPTLDLGGNLEQDIASGKIIPLRQLVTDTGPDINKNVNSYYMHYWSLTHFLLHYRDGQYSEQYKDLIALGGSLDEFEKKIGPIDEVQSEWYDYFDQQARIASDEAMRISP